MTRSLTEPVLPQGARIRRAAQVGIAAALVIAGAVACSSSSSDGGTPSAPGTPGRSSAAGDDSSIVADAQAAVDKLIRGTEGAPPSSGPKAVPGKTVWVISCGQAVPGCSLQANAAAEAAKTLGWKTNLFDGAFNANGGYQKGIRQAIAAKADGIILVSIDCVTVTQALKEAKAAGVKVVSQSSFACPDDPSLVTPMQPSADAPDIAAFGQTEGAAQADYIIAKTNGKARILNYRFVDNNFAIQINKGFETEIAKCSGCTVSNADISLSDYSNPSRFSQKASSALLGQPDANAIHVPFDSFITGGVGQAVASSGRANSLVVVGSEGFAANLNLIRQKRGQTVAIASDQRWIGWASADTMNRVFAGKGRAPEGLGFKLVDAEHNLPASGDYHTTVDFQSAYKRVWGV